MKKLAMIVAAAENEVIGVNGDLPWQISADLKRFKRLTMGHHIIMGRKTYDSIGRLLPGRTTVIITRQADFVCEGGVVANSIEEAIALCAKDDLPFITGGAEIYRLALPFVNEIHLTRCTRKSTVIQNCPKSIGMIGHSSRNSIFSKMKRTVSTIHFRRLPDPDLRGPILTVIGT